MNNRKESRKKRTEIFCLVCNKEGNEKKKNYFFYVYINVKDA